MAAFPISGQQIGASPPLACSRLDPADLPYRQLRLLVPAPSSARAIAIGSRPSAPAAEALRRLGLAERAPSADLDQLLLQVGRDGEDQGASLCLRCRVSQAAEQKLLELMARFGRSHQLDLIDLAATVLDDRGEPRPWPLAADPNAADPNAALAAPQAPHEPFSFAVLRSFRPELAGLGHWTRVRVQSHPPLVRLLRDHGLLLIRDWALLAHSSASRLERAWLLHGQAPLASAQVRALQRRFREHYQREQAASSVSARRWQPDGPFLSRVDPTAPPAQTLQRLQAMAAALRRERLDQPPQAWPATAEEIAAAPPADADDSPSAAGLLTRLEAALRTALAEQLAAMLTPLGPEHALRLGLWRLYAQGLGTREIAAACGCSQPTVSRRLQERTRAGVIAASALAALAGQEGFEAIGRSLELCETQRAALRDHLLAVPAGQRRCRLALWLEPLLQAYPTPSPASR